MSRSNGWAVFWAVVAMVLTAFGQELAAGRVPIPEDLRWLIPLVVAVISGLSPYLKKAAGEDAQEPEAGTQGYGAGTGQ